MDSPFLANEVGRHLHRVQALLLGGLLANPHKDAGRAVVEDEGVVGVEQLAGEGLLGDLRQLDLAGGVRHAVQLARIRRASVHLIIMAALLRCLDLGGLGDAKGLPELVLVVLALLKDIHLGIATTLVVTDLTRDLETSDMHWKGYLEGLGLLKVARALAVPLEDGAASVEDEDVARVHALGSERNL